MCYTESTEEAGVGEAGHYKMEKLTDNARGIKFMK